MSKWSINCDNVLNIHSIFTKGKVPNNFKSHTLLKMIVNEMPDLFYKLKMPLLLKIFKTEKNFSCRPKKLISLASGEVIISYPVLVF